MIVDNRSDASHEGQACRHIQVKMEGLAKPVNGHQTQEEKGFESAKQMFNNGGQRSKNICFWLFTHSVFTELNLNGNQQQH